MLVINGKKCASQLNVETRFQESLRDILKMDEMTSNHLDLEFELNHGEVDRNERMAKFDIKIRVRLETLTPRVEVFETKKGYTKLIGIS